MIIEEHHWNMYNVKQITKICSEGEAMVIAMNHQNKGLVESMGIIFLHKYETILYLSSPPAFSGVRVAQSLVLCVMFCR